MGLAGVAIEATVYWLRSEALPLSGAFGGMTYEVLGLVH
jgi:hypothetical protein